MKTEEHGENMRGREVARPVYRTTALEQDIEPPVAPRVAQRQRTFHTCVTICNMTIKNKEIRLSGLRIVHMAHGS